MSKIILPLFISGSLLAGCSARQELPEPPLARRTELVVLRQSTDSDAAWASI